ncbi:MAG: hypothetical protein ACRCZO_11260, partial [Cetobacterium sp.]
YDELFDYLDSLRNISVISRDSKGKLWGGFNLLAEFKKVENGVFIQIPDTIFKALCGDENEKNLYYTTIRLLEQRIYKCSYTIIFYEIFKKYENVNIPIFNLEELKHITGTSDRYLEYRYFKRDILNKSINEINKFDSKYEYSFEEKKVGRKVNEIKFIKTEKNIIDIVDSKKIKLKKEVVKIVEPKVEVLEKSELDLEKERLSLVIFKTDLSTGERIMLFGELSAIQSLESLKKLENKINSKKRN